jgi:hypothetical protein
MHHLAMAHCSGPNHTADGRFNLAIDYISPQVSPTVGEDSALPVRGTDTGAFLPETRPTADFDKAALQQFFAAVARRQKRIDQVVLNWNPEDGGDADRVQDPA